MHRFIALAAGVVAVGSLFCGAAQAQYHLHSGLYGGGFYGGCVPGSVTFTSTLSVPARPIALGDNPHPVGMPYQPQFQQASSVSYTVPVCFPAPVLYSPYYGAAYYGYSYAYAPAFFVTPYYYNYWTVRRAGGFRGARFWGLADARGWQFGDQPQVADWAAGSTESQWSDGVNLDVRRAHAAERRRGGASANSNFLNSDSLASLPETRRPQSDRETMRAEVAALVSRAEEAIADEKPRTARHFLGQARVLADPDEKAEIDAMLANVESDEPTAASFVLVDD